MTSPVFDKIIDFITGIGLPCRVEPFEGEGFLPGILIRDGGLVIDPARCTYPGDILHEAGHIAVFPPDERAALSGTITGEDGEMVVMLWSYAAALHLDLDPETVFHSQGYKGEAAWLLEQYTAGNFIGMPLMEWMGLAYSQETAKARGVRPFPYMVRWLRSGA